MGGAASWRAGGGPPGMCPMLAAAHCRLERAGELFSGPGWHVPNACWTSVSWPVGSIYAARSTAAPGMPPSPTSQPSSLPWLPTHPQVLDAPALADDYYLNLVDWSAQNTLAVGLGTCVYLWSACTSKVTRLVDFGEGGAVCRCGAGGLGGSKGSVWGGRHRVQVAGVCIRSCEQGVMEGSWLRVSKRACATCLCELFPPACPAACLGASAARTCPSVPTRGRCRSGTPPSASGEGAHVWHGRAGWKGAAGRGQGRWLWLMACGGPPRLPSLCATHRSPRHRLRRIRTLPGHKQRVGCMAWNHHTLATGSRDRAILLRDVRSQEPYVAKLAGHRSEVRAGLCGARVLGEERVLGKDDEVIKLLAASSHADAGLQQLQHLPTSPAVPSPPPRCAACGGHPTTASWPAAATTTSCLCGTSRWGALACNQRVATEQQASRAGMLACQACKECGHRRSPRHMSAKHPC